MIAIIDGRVRYLIIGIILISLLSSVGLAQQNKPKLKQINLNFKNVELRDAFRAVADIAGMNIVADNSVKGKVTVHLESVSFFEAVKFLTKTNGLEYQIIDNTVLIGTAESLQDSFKRQNKANKIEVSKGKINLNFEDMELQNAFKAIANSVGKNIIIDNSVENRKITIKLNNITFLKAVELLTKSNGLSYKVMDNTLLIGTSKSLQANFAKKITKVFKLKNSKPDKIKKSLQQFISQDKIAVDKRSKSLIITAYKKEMKAIAKVIKKLDQPQRQVIIEARIEDVSYDKLKDLGINWSFAQEGSAGEKVWDSDTGGSNGSGVLPSGRLNIGDVSMNYNSIIKALKSTGDSTTLANPRIATVDGKEAVIDVGREVPIVKKEADKDAGTTTTSVSFKNVGTVLRLTPQINSNDQIRLNIKPEVSSVYDWQGDYPVINTKKVETNIIVEDGKTIVIGGLISESEIEKLSEVPLLSSVPIFGKLFQSRNKTKEKRELIIFITPKILEDNNQQEKKVSKANKKEDSISK
ncbi:hypothetical protein JCM16358_22390 [Halanaerocella petrolearia]